MTPRSDQWTLAKGEEDGRVVIYRIRLSPPAFATKASHSRFLVVSWPFEPAGPEMLPAIADVERMTWLENLLDGAMEDHREGFLAVVVTGGGMREWFWYVRDPAATMEAVNAALGALEPFPVEFSFVEHDPDWEIYGRFLDITASGRDSV